MAKFVPQAELPVSEQAAIRREKLAALQAEGRDPFVQTKYDFNADSAAIKGDYLTSVDEAALTKAINDEAARADAAEKVNDELYC